MTAFVQKNNPAFNREIAVQFAKQGSQYGIRGDVALCQAILETGWFKYTGSAVTPEQNNFCGMGVTSPGVKGNSFGSVELGVKAHIQHLYAYSCTDALALIDNGFYEVLVDPRYHFVSRGSAPNWTDLNGKWAVPGTNYGEDILKIYNDLVKFAAGYKEPEPPKTDTVHWAELYYNYINDNLFLVKEKRFDDNLKRGEAFALIAQLDKAWRRFPKCQ